MRVDKTTMNSLKADDVLSEENMNKLFKSVSRMRPFAPKWMFPKVKAAVLIPLCLHEDGTLSILYTLRASHLKRNSGDVSFPGGKAESSDKSLIETALRETEEEIGLPRQAVEILGKFSIYIPLIHAGITVVPVIGLIRDFDRIVFKPNPSEVEDIFNVTLEKLCDRQYSTTIKQINGLLTVPVYTGGKHKIWGLTAAITHMFLSSILSENLYSLNANVNLYDMKIKSKV